MIPEGLTCPEFTSGDPRGVCASPERGARHGREERIRDGGKALGGILRESPDQSHEVRSASLLEREWEMFRYDVSVQPIDTMIIGTMKLVLDVYSFEIVSVFDVYSFEIVLVLDVYWFEIILVLDLYSFEIILVLDLYSFEIIYTHGNDIAFHPSPHIIHIV